MPWYVIVLLIFAFCVFSAFIFYIDIKRAQEYTRTEKAKRDFMRSVEFSLIAIYRSLQKIAEKN